MDERVRNLERRSAGGDPRADAALLVAQVRRAELDPKELELLAYLEHPPALRALDGDAPARPEGLESYVRGLRPWGKAVWVRAAVAAARLVLPRFEAAHPDDPRAREAIEAAEAWVAAPSPDARDHARVHAEAGYLIMRELEEEHLLMLPMVTPQAEVVLAEAFRESRAAVLAALAASDDDERAMTHAVLAGVAAREREALAETPVAPGVASPLHARAWRADRLSELPELVTPRASRLVRDAIRHALLESLLP